MTEQFPPPPPPGQGGITPPTPPTSPAPGGTGAVPPGQAPYPPQPAGGPPVPPGSPQPVPGQPLPGQQVPGQPVPGQLVPGQQVPGQPVPGQQIPGQPPLPSAEKKKSGCLKAFVITLAVVVVLGIIGAVLVAVVGVNIFNAVTAPVDSTNEYLQALQEERFDEAWASTCENFQAANPKDQFTQLISTTLEERGGIEKINASGSEIETVNGVERAKVSYTLTFGNGQSVENEADLVKEGGEWKFCGAES